MYTSFTDTKFTDSFFDFVTTLDQRLSRSLTGNTLSEVVFEGMCLDILQEIRQISEKVANNHRNVSAEAISEFSYILAAWSDEILIRKFSSDFPEIYYGYTERTLFGTAGAGEKIFEKIERLVSRKSNSDLALASVYLALLSLGFRGQYSVLDLNQTVLSYHKQLVAFATQTMPDQNFDSIELSTPGNNTPTIRTLWAEGFLYLTQLFNRKTAPVFLVLALLIWVISTFWVNSVWVDSVKVLAV